jgi:hypothetical protein
VRIDQQRGLLAQGKLGTTTPKRPDTTKWGQLTEKQKKLLPLHAPYAALLLYRLNKNQLGPFGWQSCQGVGLPEIERWLRTGTFPSESPSTTVIERLAAGSIGTGANDVIEKVIAPSRSRNVVEIRIGWPGKQPPTTVSAKVRHRQALQQHL